MKIFRTLLGRLRSEASGIPPGPKSKKTLACRRAARYAGLCRARTLARTRLPQGGLAVAHSVQSSFERGISNLNQTMGHQRTFHIYILISLSMRNPVKYIDGKF